MKRLMMYVILLSAMAVLVFTAIAAAQSGYPEGNTTDVQNSTTAPATNNAAETTTPTPKSPITRGTLPILDNYFDPAQLSIAPGTTVTIVNTGTKAHTATADNGLFDTGVLEPGESFEVYFEGSGSVTYHCKLHPEMKGSIVVGEGGGVEDPTPQEQQAAEVAPNEPNIEATKPATEVAQPSRGY